MLTMAQFRCVSANNFRMICTSDGSCIQSPINRMTLHHPFTTNPSCVALVEEDFVHLNGKYFHLRPPKGAFIHEGRKNIQNYIVSTTNDYNWLTGLPFDPLATIPHECLTQLDICEPPLFPPLLIDYNILLLPGTRAEITCTVEAFQDCML